MFKRSAAAALAAVALASAARAAVPSYTLLRFGPPDPSLDYEGGTVNAAGQVLGYSGVGVGFDRYWLATPAAGTARFVPFPADPLHFPAAGTPTGTGTGEATLLTDGGAVVGYANRYTETGLALYQSFDAWAAGPDGTPHVIGLSGDPARDAGISFNFPVDANAAGRVAGYAQRYDSDDPYGNRDAWVYTPADGRTRAVGLLDADHTRADGITDNFDTAIGPAGHVVGGGARYAGTAADASAGRGFDAWLYSPATGTTRVIGPTDPAHVDPTDGYRHNFALQVNAAGQAAGVATRCPTAADPLRDGTDAWTYSPATGTRVIGLTADPVHVDPASGYADNEPLTVDPRGDVLGYAARYELDYGIQQHGIDYWFYSAATGTTVPIGLLDAAHTTPNGKRYNDDAVMNAAGQVAGVSGRYVDGAGPVNDAWLFDPADGLTHPVLLPAALAAADPTLDVTGLTDDGTVFGDYAYATAAAARVAGLFAWSETDGFRDLSTLLPGGPAAAGFASLDDLTQVTADGYVLGTGTTLDGRRDQPFLLAPATAVPEPTATAAALAAASLGRRRSRRASRRPVDGKETAPGKQTAPGAIYFRGRRLVVAG